MRTRREVIDFYLSLDDTYEDYPFHDFNCTVMRHKGNRKMFAVIC
jgi:predicted DNA-binding protein (MmcQ/YjbR family)